jgi:hypothetical protein
MVEGDSHLAQTSRTLSRVLPSRKVEEMDQFEFLVHILVLLGDATDRLGDCERDPHSDHKAAKPSAWLSLVSREGAKP